MQVYIPDGLFHEGLIDFNQDCSEESPCGGALFEFFMSGATFTGGYVRAVNLPYKNVSRENWVQIDTEDRSDRGVNKGSLKLFFSEYSAEVDVD